MAILLKVNALLRLNRRPTGSIIVVTDTDKPGIVYFCEVISPYLFEVDGPYECSHRLGGASESTTMRVNR